MITWFIFGFCQICLMSWFLSTWIQIKISFFFVNFLWFTISSWNFFLICDITYLIYVIIYVVKKFRTLDCQKCGKYLKKRKRITKHMQKRIFFSFLLLQVECIKFLTTFYNIKNFLRIAWSSKIASYLMKMLSSRPLQWKIFFLGRSFFCENCFYSAL